MAVSSVSAKIVDVYKCTEKNIFLNHNSMVCLSADDESKVKISQVLYIFFFVFKRNLRDS